MVSEDGYTLRLADRTATAGPQAPLRFQILGPDGAPVTGYQTEHDKDLHLIAVRRDLSHFQHVHPVLDSAGTWSVPLDLSAPGEYRVFADFTPTGHDGGLVLGADLAVPGTYEPVPLPEPAATAQVVDGYQVTLAGDLVPAQASELTLTVTKDGVPVTDLQPYLAAYGHLVALRAGDLAYLHVHPAGAPGDGSPRPAPASPSTPPRPPPVTTGCSWTSGTPGWSGPAEFTVHAGEMPTDATVPATDPSTTATTTVPAPQTQADIGHDQTETGSHGH